MGVGVLIGRSGDGKQQASSPSVITVSQGSSSGSSPASEASFTSSWPAGTSGYTIQLQTLPSTGTSVAEVEKAKSSAESKGAKSVGALKSEEFSSLPSGDYLIYSGVYHKRAEAQRALGSLKKKFPGAKVVKVSESSSEKSSGSSESSSTSGSGAGSSINHPAPPSVLEGESHSHGKSYEEKSKNLPDVVSTG